MCATRGLWIARWQLALLLTGWLFVGDLGGLAAQQTAVPAKPKTAETADEIVMVKGKARLKGQIKSWTSTKVIVFKVPGKDVSIHKSDDYQISVWPGVTDADESWTAAQEKLNSVSTLLERIAKAEGVEAELTEHVRVEHKLALEFLNRIRPFEVGDAVGQFPFERVLSDAAIEALVTVTDVRKQHRKVDDRIQQALAVRRSVVSLRGQHSLLVIQLNGRFFSDLHLECGKRDRELETKIADLLDRQQSVEAHRYVQAGIKQLQAVAPHFATAKDIAARATTVLTVDDDLAALMVLLEQTKQMPGSLQILGASVVDPVTTELKQCREQHQRLRAYRDMTQELRTVLASFDNIVADFAKEETPDDALLGTRLTAQRKRLEDVIEKLKIAKPDDLSAQAVREAASFLQVYQEQGSGLQFRIELPRIMTELQRVPQVKTRAEANKLLADLSLRAATLQEYLDKKRLKTPKDNFDCGETVRLVTAGIDRLKGRVAELDRDEVRLAFRQHVSQQEAAFARVPEADSERLTAELEQLQVAVSKLADDYQTRLKVVPQKPEGAVSLLQEMRASKDDAERTVAFLTLRLDLAGINAAPADKRQLTASEDQLKFLKGRVDEQAPQLPEGVAVLRKAAQNDVARIDESLQRTRATLLFRDAEQDAVTVVSRVSSALNAGQTTTAGVSLFQAADTTSKLAALARQNPLLAKEAVFAKRATELSESLRPLSQRLDAVRLKERETAGWITWLGDRETLVAPVAEHEWLLIESLLSRRDFDEVERALGSFSRRHPEAEWRARVTLKQAELAFQRGRQWEKSGQLETARAAYQQTADARVDHPIVAAAVAATRNLDEQLRQAESVQHQWLPFVVAGGFLGLVMAVLVYGVWKRSPQSRLKFAARRLKQAQHLRSPERRESFLREAAYVLANFAADDPRVVTLWSLYTIEARRPQIARTAAAKRQVAELKMPSLAESLDAMFESAAAPEIMGTQCLAWLRTPLAGKRAQRSRSAMTIDWLREQLEPQLSDADVDLQWKLRLAAECQTLLPPKMTWPRLYQLRASFRLGQCEDALQVAQQMEPKRLSATERDEFARTVASCYIELAQWDKAEKFATSLLKRPDRPLDSEEWLATARAGQLAAKLAARRQKEQVAASTAAANNGEQAP